MKKRFLYAVTVGCVALTSVSGRADPLAPDDASIVENLLSWHRDAKTNFQEGTWKATVGKDLVEVGDAEDLDTYELPELASWTPSEGFFNGLSEVTGVRFSADVSDLLRAEEINGGDAFTDLTLIGVYQTEGNSDRTRPIGIGSRSEAAAVLGSAFNLSSDASLRYDNGNNQTDPLFHTQDLTYRVGQLFDGLVSDYLDGELITEEATPGGAFAGETRNDILYIGDVRGGLLDPFTAADLHDVFVAEVLVYNAQLTEEQVNGIGEWLQQNLATATTGDPFDFDGSGGLDVADINLLRDAVAANSSDAKFDVDQDGSVGVGDIAALISAPDTFNSYVGDANLDGEFNSGDFVAVFGAGQFEDGVPMNSTWETGDWNGDGDFGSGDFVFAFSSGGYELGPRRAVQAVPEPAVSSLLLAGLCTCLVCRRRRAS